MHDRSPRISRVCRALVPLALLGLVPMGSAASADSSFHDDCSSCHRRSTTPRLAAKEGATLDCARCHAEQGAAHAALATGEGEGAGVGCVACHDPHGGEGPFYLREARAAGRLVSLDPGSRRCVDCHESHTVSRAGMEKHPIGVRVTRSGPNEAEPRFDLPLVDVADSEDVSDDVIACTTCHDVHASPHRHLLRWSDEEFAEGCASCHRDRIYRGRTPPVEAALTD